MRVQANGSGGSTQGVLDQLGPAPFADDLSMALTSLRGDALKRARPTLVSAAQSSFNRALSRASTSNDGAMLDLHAEELSKLHSVLQSLKAVDAGTTQQLKTTLLRSVQAHVSALRALSHAGRSPDAIRESESVAISLTSALSRMKRSGFEKPAVNVDELLAAVQRGVADAFLR